MPSINLVWQLVSGASSYNIKRGNASGQEIQFANISITAGATEGTFNDASVVRGDTYFYQVTAVDANNHESAPSNEASATVPFIAAPAGLMATEQG